MVIGESQARKMIAATMKNTRQTNNFIKLLNTLKHKHREKLITTMLNYDNRQEKCTKYMRFLDWVKNWTLDCYFLCYPVAVLVMYSIKDRQTEDDQTAKKEFDSINKTFSEFEMQTDLKTFPEWTEAELFVNLEKTARRDDISGLMVVVMTHGRAGYVWDCNNKLVKIQKIITEMNRVTPKDKPKVSNDNDVNSLVVVITKPPKCW